MKPESITSAKPRVIVAMSGGVDSSVAAALLKHKGYDVIGVTMNIWPQDGAGGCCGISAAADALRVARRLEIPHYVMNFREAFARDVIADFCREYRRGRTPNPCIRCNQHIKFEALLARARELGAVFISTGHYARIKVNKGVLSLARAIDNSKDQSYFLYTLNQDQLASLLFPVGGLTKTRVRQIAAELGLPVASKPDSQEICFVPSDDYHSFIRTYLGEPEPGPVVNEQGQVLGQHRGIPFYTIGQRKGLGVLADRPLYVTAINAETNTIVAGPKQALYAEGLIATDVHWIASPPGGPVEVKAKIRHRHPEVEATVTPDGNSARVKFRQPQVAVTPGQAVVFYDGDDVLGGGTIERAVKPQAADMATIR